MGFNRIRALASAVGLASMLSLVTVLPGSAASTTVTVSPANMQGWGFVQESPTAPGSGTLVLGPAIPPAGVGSARLAPSSATQGQALIRTGFQGVRLADLTTLSYSTFRSSGGAAEAIALQFTIDSDVTDANNAFQGRLVFEPYQEAPSGTVVGGTWQTWSPLQQGSWWGTPGAGTRPLTTACPQSNPCTLAEILAQFPNAGIHSTDAASIVLKAGSGWANFEGNVDALSIGTSSGSTTFDFEPYDVATDKDECKSGGWQNVRRADGSPFKNQGDCVSYANTGR